MARVALAVSFVAVLVAVLASASLGRSGPGPARAGGPSARGQFPFFDQWAVVKYDGTIVYRSGVASVTRVRKGDYVVTFFRPVLNCAWLATVRTFSVGGDEPSAVGVKTATHYTGAAPNFTVDPRSIEVWTFNDTGTTAGFADASFSVEAVC